MKRLTPISNLNPREAIYQSKERVAVEVAHHLSFNSKEHIKSNNLIAKVETKTI
jgi:hypothetical protein